MGIFSNLTREGLEAETESLGFTLFDSNVYEATIKIAYTGVSKGGARFITFVFDINGQQHTETLYITNKSGQNFYTSSDKKKKAIPGFLLADNICILTSDQPLASQETEEKIFKVYDPELKKQVNKSVPTLTSLLNKKIYLAIFRDKVNKRELKDGSYVDSNETREENSLDRVFSYEYHLTCTELYKLKDKCTKENKDFLQELSKIDKSDPELFINKWLAKNKGVIRDRTNKNNGNNESAAPSAKPVKSLFSN